MLAHMSRGGAGFLTFLRGASPYLGASRSVRVRHAPSGSATPGTGDAHIGRATPRVPRIVHNSKASQTSLEESPRVLLRVHEVA